MTEAMVDTHSVEEPSYDKVTILFWKLNRRLSFFLFCFVLCFFLSFLFVCLFVFGFTVRTVSY